MQPENSWHSYSNPPLAHISSQMNPIQTLQRYLFQALNSVLLSTPRFSEWLLSFKFPNKILCAFLSYTIRSVFLASSTLFYLLLYI